MISISNLRIQEVSVPNDPVGTPGRFAEVHNSLAQVAQGTINLLVKDECGSIAIEDAPVCLILTNWLYRFIIADLFEDSKAVVDFYDSDMQAEFLIRQGQSDTFKLSTLSGRDLGKYRMAEPLSARHLFKLLRSVARKTQSEFQGPHEFLWTDPISREIFQRDSSPDAIGEVF